MDIELRLRELLALRDPGARFTDGVMTRVGDARVPESGDGVVQIADARARKGSRRILLITVVAVVAAAAVPTLLLRDPAEPPAAQDATTALAAESPTVPAFVGPVSHESADAGLPGGSTNPLDCLDMDVLYGLLLPGVNHKMSVAGDLPPEFTGFQVPRQFSLIGTSEPSPPGTGQTSVTTVFRSNLGLEAARAEGVRALTAGGWQANPDEWLPMMSVFKAGNTEVTGDSYCREGQRVAISASAIDGVTYVRLSTSRNANRGGSSMSVNACDELPRRPGILPSTASVPDQYMPTLELPRDPSTGQPVASGGGGSGSSGSRRTENIRFVARDSVSDVGRNFARQMAEQGWINETSWNGASSSGSTWTRRMGDESVLRGMLMISAFDGGLFVTDLHVVRAR